jgi:hypothetical protein
MLEQHQENLKRLFLQTNAPLALAQFACADVEFKLTEADLLGGNMPPPRITNRYNLPHFRVSATVSFCCLYRYASPFPDRRMDFLGSDR